jgi:hypothetical protein
MEAREAAGQHPVCKERQAASVFSLFIFLPGFDEDRVGEEKLFEIPSANPSKRFQSMLSLINARASSEPCACRQSVQVSLRFLRHRHGKQQCVRTVQP